MTTTRAPWQRPTETIFRNPLETLLPPSPEAERVEAAPRSRPWARVLVAVLAAVLAVFFAGQTASKLWLEDLDSRLLDAGAGTNAGVATFEREHLEAFRSIAFTEGFAPALATNDVATLERRLTPVDANHGIPMIDVIDDRSRVVFAFRAAGTIRPVYRDRRATAIVGKVLAGEQDAYGERFTELITTDEGPLLATAGPVRDGDRIVGAVLLMTPVDEVLSVATNQHGARLTAYSLDRGDPLATTTPNRPKTLGTALRTRLGQPEQLPHGHGYEIAGTTNREQIGSLVVRHENVALLGAALPDRSGYVAWRVMVIVATGLALMALIVATVVYAWVRDRYDLVGRAEREPLALPAPRPPDPNPGSGLRP